MCFSRNIKRNLELTGGQIFGEAIVTELVERRINRQDAHEILRKISIKAPAQGFKKALFENKEISKYLSQKELEKIMDYKNYIGFSIEKTEKNHQKMASISQIDLPLKLFKRGKVRDVYELDKEKLVIVVSDRISAFNVVLPSLIPFKGQVLTGLSVFWFKKTKKIIENHLITNNLNKFPQELKKYPQLKGRTMIVKRAKPIAIECIVRGYLFGSAWKNYQEGKKISGIKLPKGLRESEKLPEPIFSPTTKAITGHDQEITENEMKDLVGKNLTKKLKEMSLKIYSLVSKLAEKRGIIIADTKFEFGLINKKLILIDELLTPDSSRFWPKDEYSPGKSQKSFDKQFVRDYLMKIGWDKTPPGPQLPEEIIEKTSQKYIEAYQRITGKKFIF